MATVEAHSKRPGRRPELTFRDNRGRGRHGWLRLTPAYSTKLVESLLDTVEEGASILDPFAGTSTTPLCAATRGFRATGVDINPFLVWFGTAKLRIYEDAAIDTAMREGGRIAASLARQPPAAPPPIHRIERWWESGMLLALRRLKGGIDAIEAASDGPTRDLLLIAFSRVMIASSNAAFDHPSMSFRAREPSADDPIETIREGFRAALASLCESATARPLEEGEVLLGDARTLEALENRAFDRVITSPPYPNRMSYIRELRPYMYWLGHLAEAREAGELDWRAMGGTWGVATSRLAHFEPSPHAYRPATLKRAAAAIEEAHPKNGALLSRYVLRYFEDAMEHLASLRAHLVPGARVDYVVGNSTFYGVLLSVEEIYASMLAEHGFQDVSITTVRKRNSKRALYEFRVSARAT